MRTAQYTFAKGATLYDERNSLLQRFICFFGRFSALHGAVTYKSAYFIHKIHRRRHLQGAKSVRFCAAAQFFFKNTNKKTDKLSTLWGVFYSFLTWVAEKIRAPALLKSASQKRRRFGSHPHKCTRKVPFARSPGPEKPNLTAFSDRLLRLPAPSSARYAAFFVKEGGGEQDKPGLRAERGIKEVPAHPREKAGRSSALTRSAHNHIPSAM